MTTINNNFAKTLSEARTRLGLSQSAFADRFGLRQQTYQNYEKGRVPKDATLLQGLASGLGMTVDDLLGFGKPFTTENNGDCCDLVVEEQSERYSLPPVPWKNASTDRLQTLLELCVKEMDYGAVSMISDELLNRKIQEKLI